VIVTINVAVLLAIIIVVRLRRRTHARSRVDEKMTVVICLTFGVLIAPTAFGQTILDVVGQLVEGLSKAGQ
jgi:nucleoside permease NupC